MIAAALVRLASHYHRPDFGPEQAKYMALDFIEDLQPFTMAEIENGIRDYRRDAKNKFFPTPGQLLEVLAANRKHHDQLGAYKPLNPEYGTPRPHMWWMQAPYLWQPHWQESEIPEAHRTAFAARLKAKRAAGAEGWAVADFAGLARKHQGDIAP